MAYTIKTEGRHAGEHLLSEGNGEISREGIVLAAGPMLPAGQVLALKTATGEYVAYKKGEAGGVGTAAGILFAPKPESATPQRAVAHVRNCEVAQVCLTGLDDKAIADLAARSVIVR